MNKSKSPYSLFNNYRFMLSGMWNYDKSLIGYGIAEVIFGVLMPLGAVIVPSVVIGLLEDKAGIDVFIRNIIILFAIYGVVAAIQAFLTSRNRNQYIDIRMMLFSHRLFSKCMGMDYQLYENESVREEKEKALRGTYTNQQGIEGIMHHNVKLLTNLLGMIAYAAIIGVINPVILLLLVVISLVQMLVYNRAKSYEHSKKDEMSKLNVTQKYLQEQAFDLKAGKDIRLYQLNRLIDRVYDKTNRSLKNIKTKIQGAYYANDVVEVILKFVRDAVCYGYLIYLLMNGLKVSYFVLYIGIVGGLATWVMKITEEISKISRDLLMISDFREFIDIKDEFRHKGGKEITEEDTAFDIVFDHVSYRYKGASDYVLRDVSFHMKKGDTFALVGINGAGKTTLVKLMCGFYQPTEGRILINGVDMKELNIEGYFKKIAVVFQDSNPLSFTIGENISGEETKYINKEKLNKALELSGLKSKIDKLEKGTDTYLNKDMDDSGIQLSGGELQKLMLAKALYKEARLLLLDEPTAALDAIAESELYEKYQGLLKGKTSLFISHRLASTRFCNHILFLENGRIAEEGNHDSLMEQKGKYAEMFNVQSQYYKEEEYETEENLS
ncbi:ABC transporter ATP-binding protein [Clostridium sp. KNHs205]|uniref:ABC transporter ATP-binding protein n=1 Tax=Clostridium sp. KNHs205 TaxID=1449050 RepID=UPI00051C8AD2|nr:ABC transporter ATP-binding protein [Clostridium sp. KNHs205]